MAENPLHWPVAPVPVVGSDDREARAPVVVESACISWDQCWQWKTSQKDFGVLVAGLVARTRREQLHLHYTCNKIKLSRKNNVQNTKNVFPEFSEFTTNLG